MELIIKRSRFKSNYEYEVYHLDKLIYTSKTKGISIPNLRKIYLYEPDGKKVCCLKQESWLKIIIRILPFTCFFSFSVCPYIYYKNGVKEGYMRERINGGGYVYGEINGAKYELQEHTGNDISIFCNEKQVGLIKRRYLKELDRAQFKVLYNRSFEKELAAIFSLLVDTLWYTHDEQWQYSIQLRGKKLEEDWVPED